MFYRHPLKVFCLTNIISLALLRPLPAAESTEVHEVSLSAADADQALAGKKTYTFVVLSNGEFVDQDAHHFTLKTAKEYLERTKPDIQAAYTFLLSNDNDVNIAKAAIQDFSNYGAAVFVVRKIDAPKKPEPKLADENQPPKTVTFVGQPNPQSLTANDKAPPMSDRPESLRPGKLPARVRYVFKSDSEVVAAARKVETLLLGEKRPASADYFDQCTLIEPGAWKHLSHLTQLNEAKSLTARVELGPRVIELEGKILSQPEQFSKAVDEIRDLITIDGGGTVRALTSAEMNFWWTFISFDIEEPVFILETKGAKYRFVINILKDHVISIDELNIFLPPKKKTP